MYLVASVAADTALTEETVRSFFDLYAYERGWTILQAYESEASELMGRLRDQLFQLPTADSVAKLVRARRFVVLQGAPGTGKTRLAEQAKLGAFANQGSTIQFHPSVTYEDFVVGLSPDTADQQLRFCVRASFAWPPSKKKLNRLRQSVGHTRLPARSGSLPARESLWRET